MREIAREMTRKEILEGIETIFELDFPHIALPDKLEVLENMNVVDFQFDSLDVVEFIMELEEEFDIIVSDKEFDNLVTVKDLANLIEKSSPKFVQIVSKCS